MLAEALERATSLTAAFTRDVLIVIDSIFAELIIFVQALDSLAVNRWENSADCLSIRRDG